MTSAFRIVSDVEQFEKMDSILIEGSAWLLVIILAMTSAIAFAIGADRLTATLPLALLAWDVGCLWLARTGRPKPAAIALCLGLMAMMLLTAPFYGGLQGTTIQALPMMPLFAALLVSPTAGVVMAVVAAALVVLQWYAEVNLGYAPVRTPTPEDQIITTIGLVSTIAMLSGLKVFQLRRAATAARDAAEVARSTEANLREALATATAASEAKSQFLSNMSHELRTPLNAIIGYAEFLAEDTTDEDTAHDLERIRTAGGHLLQLVNDVLDLGKIEAGEMEVMVETVELAPLLEDVATTVYPAVQQRGSDLVLEIPPDIGSVVTDPVRLRQILLNLLSNAAKFTEHGSVVLTACRRPGPAGGGASEDVVTLAVRDTGIGIAPDKLDQLFKPFVQGDATTSRRYGGTGLGLALSAHFARLLGAQIDVRSRPGKGSTFTLLLPAGAAGTPAASGLRTEGGSGSGRG